MQTKSPDSVALGAAVRHLRQAQGMTLETLAAKAGLHWTYVGGIERGERNPSWGNVIKLANGLGVTIVELASHVAQRPSESS